MGRLPYTAEYMADANVDAGDDADANDGVALAKVILITRDEHELIDDFLEYYGNVLFGMRNVVVIDNGSTDARVLECYRRNQPLGLTVVRDERPFRDAASFMSEHMRALAPSCRFMLPLETDEFLFMRSKISGMGGDDDYVICAEDVNAVLRAVPAEVSVVRYGSFWGSAVDPADGVYETGEGYPRPARQMTRFYDQDWDKIIVRSAAFLGMSQWCHRAATTGRGAVSHDLGLVHFHETGFRRQVQRSLSVVRSYGYVDFDAPLRAQQTQSAAAVAAGVACGHKVEYYDTYLRRRLAVDAFLRVHGRLPRDVAEMNTYAQAPDVVAAVEASAAGRAAPLAFEGPCDHPSDIAKQAAVLVFAEPNPRPGAPFRVTQVARALGATV